MVPVDEDPLQEVLEDHLNDTGLLTDSSLLAKADHQIVDPAGLLGNLDNNDPLLMGNKTK